MDTTHTITTKKGEFLLSREESADIGVSICLPETLTDLSEDELAQTFSVSDRSIVVKTDKESKVAFVMNATDVAVQEDMDEEAFVKGLFAAQHTALSRLVPGYQEYGIKSKKIADHTVICAEYMAHSLEDDLYNIFFLFVHEGKMIYGTFSYLLEDAPELNIMFLVCLDSLQFTEN